MKWGCVFDITLCMLTDVLNFECLELGEDNEKIREYCIYNKVRYSGIENDVHLLQHVHELVIEMLLRTT